jgi:hypothetical protein
MAKGNVDDVPTGYLLAMVGADSSDADLPRLSWFLSHGGNPEVYDDAGNSLLARAVLHDKWELARQLGAFPWPSPLVTR